MFYTFHQNNSGGYFIENDHVGAYVIIEAGSVEEAIEKVYDITEPYGRFCECCGARWECIGYIDEEDGTNNPMINEWPVEEALKRSIFGETAIIYYADGYVQHIKRGDN